MATMREMKGNVEKNLELKKPRRIGIRHPYLINPADTHLIDYNEYIFAFCIT